MKKLICVCIMLFGTAVQASELGEFIQGNLKDSTLFQFVLQFQGSEAFTAIKDKHYDVDYWVSMAESNDPLASYMLLNFYLVTDKTKNAIKYGEITYHQTNEKLVPLSSLYSLFQKSENQTKAAAVAYLMGMESEPLKNSDMYSQYVAEIGEVHLEELAKRYLKHLEKAGKRFSNHFVTYSIDI